MKRVLKQPAFWVTFFCLVFAVCTAVGSSLLNPGIAALDKFEKGMNKGKTATVVSCFTPDVQAEMKALGELGDSLFDIVDAGKLNILYGDVIKDEEGVSGVQAFLIYNQDGQCVEADYEEIDLEEVGGKVYLSAY